MTGKPVNPLPPFIGPMVLFTDIAAAAAVWIFRHGLLGDAPDTDMIAGAIAGFLVLGGLVAFMVFRSFSRKVL